MKDEQENIITIPLEFKVACAIKYLVPEQVLQCFIDHISIYISLSSDYIQGYREATNTLSKYSVANAGKRSKPVFVVSKKEFAVNCIREIVALSFKKKMSADKRRLRSKPMARQLWQAMEPNGIPDTIYLDEENILHLTDDFRIICNMHQHNPKTFLEYFMSQISLAEAHARITLNKVVENHALSFFFLLTEGFANILVDDHSLTELEYEFIYRSQEFRHEVFLYRDVDKRKAKFQEFYQNYYQKLIQQNH